MSEVPPRSRILILFAHPALEKSRVNQHLIRAVRDLEGVTFQDLYEAYPDLDIDVAHEQSLLESHDVIILQHPFFWYSAPAIVKEWEDLVLEHGWAYGHEGTALQGKRMMSAITTGAGQDAYGAESFNKFTIREFLAPKFAKWWLPDAYVFVDEIPRTSAGKLKKSALREQFKDWEWD